MSDMTPPSAAIAGAYIESARALAVTLVSQRSLTLDPATDIVALTISSAATSASAVDLDSVNTSGIVLDVDVTPAKNTAADDDILDIAYSLTVDDGSTITKQGSIVKISNLDTETSGSITNTVICVEIVNGSNAAHDTGFAVSINQVGVLAAANEALYITSSAAQTNSPLVLLEQKGATSTTSAAVIDCDSNVGSSYGLDIDRDGTSNTDMLFGLKIAADNAGTAGCCGIDLSSFAADEPLINLPVDANAVGAGYGRMAVYVTGVGVKYIELYDAP